MRRALRTGVLALVALLGAGTSALAATAEETRLGAAMETAFRACALQVSTGNYLTEANASELTGIGITLGGAPAPELASMFAASEYGAPTFAKLASPDAVVWLAGFGDKRICKVLVADSGVALGARLELDRRFRATTSWSVDPPASGSPGLFVQSFTLNAARPGPHMKLVVSGPNAVASEGRGPQALMTVAIAQ